MARVYDALDQAGPDSNLVSVTFNDAQFAAFGTRVTLTSIFARRGAPPGQELTWPDHHRRWSWALMPSVLTGAMARRPIFSAKARAGTFTIKHIYKTAGIYKIIIKATDKNGSTAFLQLVGQATGATQNNSKKDGSGLLVKNELLWWPAIAMFPLVGASFWVGRRHELYTLRKQLEKTRDKEQR